MKIFRLKIKRQDGVGQNPYWEKFELKFQTGMTVISALRAIRKKPVNADERAVAPVVWSCECLQGQCGSCAMVINGQAMLACQARLEDFDQPLTVEPLSKFEVLRDLVVERKKTNVDEQRLQSWMQMDDYEAKRVLIKLQPKNDLAFNLGQCIDCGICEEACPQYNSSSPFIGPKLLAQTYRLHQHANGKIHQKQRSLELRKEGGAEDCDNSQNCVRVCPAGISLTDAIGKTKREFVWSAVKDFFSLD